MIDRDNSFICVLPRFSRGAQAINPSSRRVYVSSNVSVSFALNFHRELSWSSIPERGKLLSESAGSWPTSGIRLIPASNSTSTSSDTGIPTRYRLLLSGLSGKALVELREKSAKASWCSRESGRIEIPPREYRNTLYTTKRRFSANETLFHMPACTSHTFVISLTLKTLRRAHAQNCFVWLPRKSTNLQIARTKAADINFGARLHVSSGATQRYIFSFSFHKLLTVFSG